MAGIAKVIQISQNKKSIPHYTIGELRLFAKDHNLKIIGKKHKISNNISDHLNYKILTCDHYI